MFLTNGCCCRLGLCFLPMVVVVGWVYVSYQWSIKEVG